MKILVTGNAGSGKSTLAKTLAAKHALPYSSLDRVVWQEGWKKTPRDIRKAKIKTLIKRNNWVIDGVDYDVQHAADVVIFLDYPRGICLYRALRRNIPYLFSSRPELPKHCPEIRIIPQLLKIIWNFPKRVRPTILSTSSRERSKFVHIKTNNELQSHLEGESLVKNGKKRYTSI
jgi:adenylate kinase family enzyme